MTFIHCIWNLKPEVITFEAKRIDHIECALYAIYLTEVDGPSSMVHGPYIVLLYTLDYQLPCYEAINSLNRRIRIHIWISVMWRETHFESGLYLPARIQHVCIEFPRKHKRIFITTIKNSISLAIHKFLHRFHISWKVFLFLFNFVWLN